MINHDLAIMKDFIEKYIKLHTEGLKNLPYNVNVIDELHASENAHSRILNKLLQYQHDGHFVFFESFVEKVLKLNLDKLDIKSPVFTSEKDRIDVLIVEKNKYAIIIENKIHGAIDQTGQLDRYIKKVQDQEKIHIDKIYVVYLTREGEKEISDDSLSKLNRQKLAERYSPRNYRDDILPWLRTLLPVPNGEEQIYCAVKQYTDHLDNLFELNPNMQKMNNQIIYELINEYKKLPLTDLSNRINDLEKLKKDMLPECINVLRSELNARKRSAIENVCKKAGDSLKEKGIEPSFKNMYGGLSCSIKIRKCNNHEIFLICEYDSEAEDLKIGAGREEKRTDKKTKEKLMRQDWFKKFIEERGADCGTNGWYAYYSLNIPLSNQQLLIDTIVKNMVDDYYRVCPEKKQTHKLKPEKF